MTAFGRATAGMGGIIQMVALSAADLLPLTAPSPPSRLMPAAEFIIRPNSACNDGSWRWVFASLVVVAAAIAIRFAALGLWMVVPFTLAEILALGLGLWVMLQRSYTEKVLVGDEVVEIRHLEKGANRIWQLPRRRTRVKICDRRHPCRLVLGHAGQWVEIGGCLTDPERRSLARALRAAGIGS